MEKEIENRGIIDGLNLVASPIVSGTFLDGSLSLNCSSG